MDEPVSMTHFDPKEGVLVIGGREFTATDDPRVWQSGDYFLQLREDMRWNLIRGDVRVTTQASLEGLVPYMPVQA